MNKAIQQAIDLVGSQRELARVSGVRQSTISVLLNGRNGKIFMPRHSTARRFEAATNGRIKWHQFFEEEQGATQETPHGTEAAETPCCPTHLESDRTGSAAFTPAGAFTEAKYQQAADPTDTGVCSSASIPVTNEQQLTIGR